MNNSENIDEISSNPSPVPSPASPAAPSRPPRAPQSSRLAGEISAVAATIRTARVDETLSYLLRQRGFEARHLDAGLALQRAAQAAFTHRQRMMGAKTAGARQWAASVRAARAAFIVFRRVARAAFSQAADHEKLGVTGRLSKNPDALVTCARASYTMALTEPYATVLDANGLSLEAMAAMLAEVEALNNQSSAWRRLQGAAQEATRERDAACAALRRWRRGFAAVASAVFRDHPEQSVKLKLAA